MTNYFQVEFFLSTIKNNENWVFVEKTLTKLDLGLIVKRNKTSVRLLFGLPVDIMCTKIWAHEKYVNKRQILAQKAYFSYFLFLKINFFSPGLKSNFFINLR